jgi:hypothetical protein
MALSRLTNFVLNANYVRLDYADGRQWYIPYGQIIATLIDPTSGQYVANLFERGLVGETLEATQADLLALGTNVQGFIFDLNNKVSSNAFWTTIYNDYSTRATTDGAVAFNPTAYRCGKDRFIELMPLATEGYRLVWNTQFRSLADGGNGFDSRTLDCSADILNNILN